MGLWEGCQSKGGHNGQRPFTSLNGLGQGMRNLLDPDRSANYLVGRADFVPARTCDSESGTRPQHHHSIVVYVPAKI